MLVLTRLTNEGIEIGNGIIVRILSVAGNRVSVGIDAPREIRVDREEVAKRKRAEQPDPRPRAA